MKTESKLKEEMARIVRVWYGREDHGFIGLFLDVEFLSGQSIVRIGQEDLNELLKEHLMEDTNNLKGKNCVVQTGDGMVRFVRLFE